MPEAGFGENIYNRLIWVGSREQGAGIRDQGPGMAGRRPCNWLCRHGRPLACCSPAPAREAELVAYAAAGDAVLMVAGCAAPRALVGVAAGKAQRLRRRRGVGPGLHPQAESCQDQKRYDLQSHIPRNWQRRSDMHAWHPRKSCMRLCRLSSPRASRSQKIRPFGVNNWGFRSKFAPRTLLKGKGWLASRSRPPGVQPFAHPDRSY